MHNESQLGVGTLRWLYRFVGDQTSLPWRKSIHTAREKRESVFCSKFECKRMIYLSIDSTADWWCYLLKTPQTSGSASLAPRASLCMPASSTRRTLPTSALDRPTCPGPTKKLLPWSSGLTSSPSRMVKCPTPGGLVEEP